jgi:hypothetical protein
LQENIGHLLKRPVGRPPQEVRRYYASFSYQAGSWNKPRRVVAKVEWQPGELYPRVGFIVTTHLSRLRWRIVSATARSSWELRPNAAQDPDAGRQRIVVVFDCAVERSEKRSGFLVG